MSIFVNHTNHPSERWDAAQRAEALKYGEIIDLPFPNIPPAWESTEVAQLARKTAEQIAALKPAAVLCQGEFTYAFRLIELLKAQGIKTLAATSERVVSEQLEAGVLKRTYVFSFCRFREY